MILQVAKRIANIRFDSNQANPAALTANICLIHRKMHCTGQVRLAVGVSFSSFGF